MSNPLAGQGAAQGRRGRRRPRSTGPPDRRRRHSASATIIEAVAAYYEDFANRSERARQEARAKAFEALAARYPERRRGADLLRALHRRHANAGGPDLRRVPEGGRDPREAVRQVSRPSGRRALPDPQLRRAADRRARASPPRAATPRIAPDAPHALHMPSHIFTRVGAWEESVATNRRSARSRRQATSRTRRITRATTWCTRYLQLARDDEARRAIDEAMKVQRLNRRASPPPTRWPRCPRATRSSGAHGGGDAAAARSAASMPFVEAITYFARALGAARSGEAAAAKAERAVAARRSKLQDAKNTYWATEVEVQRLATAGWIALAEERGQRARSPCARPPTSRTRTRSTSSRRGASCRARAARRHAARAEAAQALKEYEVSQEREPNRFRGLYGAGVAASRSGNTAKAKEYFSRLVEMAGSGSPRTEIVNARAYLARN